MLKLVQELRGLAQITNRRPQNRTPAAALLEVRSLNRRSASARRKRTIQIRVQEPLDIPHAIKIKHVTGSAPYSDNPHPEI